MKPFRKHCAIAIDGGGIRGAMVAKALAVVEEALGEPLGQVCRLTAGTSTGSIIAAAIAVQMPAAQVHELYVQLGGVIFRKTWRSWLWPLTRYRYSNRPFIEALRTYLGDRTMGEFWKADPPMDVVITMHDLVENRTRFVKPWKEEYARFPVWKAVLASSSVPTYFPVVDGRYVDGGVGSYANPCYIAAYEAAFCLDWDPAETTLISIGTGRAPGGLKPGEASRFFAWQWIAPILDAFIGDASDQQVRLVQQFFPELDFRRFQIDLETSIPMDDPAALPELTRLGERLGQMILNDETDPKVARPAGKAGAAS